MIIVVGGNARNVGKTSLICGILQAFPELEWRVLKITPHEHRSEAGDTQRYLAAGAREAYLNGVESFETGNWLIESNRIMEKLEPDAYIFIQATAPEDEKPRDRWHLDRATLVLKDWPPSEELPTQVRQLISSLSK